MLEDDQISQDEVNHNVDGQAELDMANGQEEDVDMFNINEFLPPEIAHTQIGFVHTHFFPVND
jgi:hypothetical protein